MVKTAGDAKAGSSTPATETVLLPLISAWRGKLFHTLYAEKNIKAFINEMNIFEIYTSD